MKENQRKCCKCGNSVAKDPTIKLYRYPKPGVRNILRCELWAKFIAPEGLWTSQNFHDKLHSNHTMICSNHFEEKCFINSAEKKLFLDAMPTLEINNVTHTQGRNSTLPEPTEMDSSIDVPKRKKRQGILRKFEKFKDLSEREQKLYKTCHKRLISINRLRKQFLNKKAKYLLKNLYEDEDVELLSKLKLSNSLTILIQNQLSKQFRKPKRRKFTLKKKLMALQMYKKSPACYRLLRRMAALPTQKSLNKMLDKVPLQPGINRHIFDSLRQTAKYHLYARNNVCILSFNEMALKNQDHGDQSVNNKALVFMLSGVIHNWKQPIAFYYLNSLNIDSITDIVKEILGACFKARMIVVGTVCNLSIHHLNILESLGATTTKPYFTFEGREIVTILDPPHLLRCTRNLLMKHDIEFSLDCGLDGKPMNGTAKWSHIELYNKQTDCGKKSIWDDLLTMGPILSDSHMNPNAKQRRRTYLAAQIFSHRVTVGFFGKMAAKQLPSEAIETNSFIKKFDELMDALNADTPKLRGGKKYSNNITDKTDHLKFFTEIRQFICSMKYVGRETTPLSEEGWIFTLNAIERLWKNLHAVKVKSLSTRRLNLDALNNFFASIRYFSGSNYRPTKVQFVDAFKTAILSNLKYNWKQSYCQDDKAILTNDFNGLLRSEKAKNKKHKY